MGATECPRIPFVQREAKGSKKVQARPLQSNWDCVWQVSRHCFPFIQSKLLVLATGWDLTGGIVSTELYARVPNISIRGKGIWWRSFWKLFSGEFVKKDWTEVFTMLLFSAPKQYISQTEHPDIHEYSNIYNYNCREKGCHRKKRMPREFRDCTSEYPDCEFSLLEMILGRYAVEPTKHGPAVNVPFMWINDRFYCLWFL